MPEAAAANDGRPSRRGGASTPHTPRRPEETLLHQTLCENLETFLARARDGDRPVPYFVEREFHDPQASLAPLECGVLVHGFLRLHGHDCGPDRPVAFWCKRRGFCPSCGRPPHGGYRSTPDRSGAAWGEQAKLATVRQWVLTLPYPLRYRCVYDARLTPRASGAGATHRTRGALPADLPRSLTRQIRFCASRIPSEHLCVHSARRHPPPPLGETEPRCTPAVVDRTPPPAQ
jgi:hypothetical protein